MRFQDVMLSGRERHREALEEARAAGRLGCARLPLAISSDVNVSDTMLNRCLDAHAEGLAERAQEDGK